MGRNRFSSKKRQKDIVAFQNYAWKKCQSCYNLLVGRFSGNKLNKTIKHLSGFLRDLKASRQYKKVRKQTEEYLMFCKNQWKSNYPVTSKIIEKLTGLKLNKKFTIYITHPTLRNGSYIGNNIIQW
jgi:hypothetical protein